MELNILKLCSPRFAHLGLNILVKFYYFMHFTCVFICTPTEYKQAQHKKKEIKSVSNNKNTQKRERREREIRLTVASSQQEKMKAYKNSASADMIFKESYRPFTF